MRTIRKVLREASPRAPLCKRLGISVQYAADIAASGKPIGGAATLARVSAELGLDDAEIGASLREMFPEPFGRARAAAPEESAA